MQLVINFKGSFSPTNESVVVMGKDKKVYIYQTADLMTPDPVEPQVIEADTKSMSLAWSPDCTKLLIGAWYESIVVNVATKEKIAKVKMSAWNNDGCNVCHVHWIDNSTVIGKWEKGVKAFKIE